MMQLELNVEDAIRKLDSISQKDIEEKGHHALVDVMAKLEEYSVRFVAVDQGILRSRIHTVWITPLHAVLQDGTNYGVYVEFGTEPHEILPFVKKALHWDEDKFAKRVFHPGTMPHPFFRTARTLVINQDLPIIAQKYFGNLAGV